MPYKYDGTEIYRPGEQLPTDRARSSVGRPAQGQDLSWIESRTGPIARWRDRRLARTVQAQARGLEIATEYQRQARTYEKARQELELAHHEASLLPLKIEGQRQALEAQLLHGEMALNEMLQEQRRAAELAAVEHKTALLHRKADKLEARARVKEARRTVKDAGKKKRVRNEVPEEFERAWATEGRVRRNRSEADRRIDEIYDRAKAERRPLSPDEIEEIDALQDSSAAAEDEVRRRAASGLS